jgi:hypothetical protein
MAAPTITVKTTVVDAAVLAAAHAYYDDDGEAETHGFEDIIECCEGGQDREFIGDFLRAPPSHVIRAKIGETTVGFAFLFAKEPAAAPFRATMGTFCGWEEEGAGKEMIGKKIMKAAEKRARDRGYTSLLVDPEDLFYKQDWDEDEREEQYEYLSDFFDDLGYVPSVDHPDTAVMVKNLLPPGGEVAALPAAAAEDGAGPGTGATGATMQRAEAARAAREARMAEGRRQEAEFDEIEAEAARRVAANTSEAGIGTLPTSPAESSEELPKEEEEALIGKVPKGGRKTRRKARKTRKTRSKKRITRKRRTRRNVA